MKKTKLVKFVAAGEHVKHQKEGKGKYCLEFFRSQQQKQQKDIYFGHCNVSTIYHERNPSPDKVLPLFFLSDETNILVKNNYN